MNKLRTGLVLLTFRPIPNAEDLTVDHLNHNKRDNSLSNLEWVSKVENQERAKTDLLKDQQLKTEVVLLTQTVICGGNAMFTDFDAAAEFIMAACLKNTKQIVKKQASREQKFFNKWRRYFQFIITHIFY